MRIVQLSDLHLRPGLLYSGIDPWQALENALLRLAGLVPRPDLLLLTGDLADDGAPVSYARLATRLAALDIPYAVLPGNHDQPAALKAAFPNQAWAPIDPACQRLDFADCSLLLLDTSVAGEEWGELSSETLSWLESACPTERRVLLALHHPPFAVGIPGMDVIACRDGERLARWLAKRPNVEALLCGHVHRHVVTAFAGHLAMTCPSTVHQIAFGQGGLAWTNEMPGMLVHDLPSGQALGTHYLPVAAAPVVSYTD